MTTIGILVDCSGSMYTVMDTLRKALFTKVTELSAKGTMRLGVWGFSGYEGASPAQSFWEVLPIGGTPDWDRFMALRAENGTQLAPALYQAAAAIRAAAQGEPSVLIVLTDGQPSDKAATVVARQVIAGPDLSLAVVFFNYLKSTPADEAALVDMFGPVLTVLENGDVAGAIAAITRITG